MLEIGNGNITEELKKICEENNLTAYKLAKYTNISTTYAYNILNGKNDSPSAWIIDRINKGLKENAKLIKLEKKRENKMDIVTSSGFHKKDYQVTEAMTVEQMKEEIQNLRYFKACMEFKINSLEDYTWSNDACKGYLIKAMEDSEFKEEDIKKVIGELRYTFDFNSLDDAKQIYMKSKY